MIDVFLLESSQFFKVLVNIGVKIVDRLTVVTRFRAEKDHQDELEAAEWKENPETILPAQVCSDGSCNDGNQVGNSAEDEIKKGDSNTTFVNKVHVADDSDDN